ncbi:MAG: hypothetical protein Q7J35_12430 [Candidatus Methanoperedens sp.]|nr:hypothetical protein [Candidatus Methanoperedens sp.]
MGKIDNLGIALGNKIAHFDNRLSKIEFELTDIKVKVAQIQQYSHNPKTKISHVE